MKWYDGVRDFLYVHTWLQGLIFGSLIAIIGGGSFLHRRKERKHAKDLVEANQQANTYREEANRLSTELLQVHMAQAETASLIGLALNQQGKVLDEQTKIMANQFELQRRVESKTERDSLLTSVVAMLGAFRALRKRLLRIQLSNVTEKDIDEVSAFFDRLNTTSTSCTKALWTAVHISKEEREYFLNHSKKLSTLEYNGDIRKALQDITTIDVKPEDPIFLGRLGALAKTPEIGGET